MPKSVSENLVVYTDGGSRGNPGPAALGVYITDHMGHPIKSYSEALGIKTNNEAEYQAVIFALKKLKALVGKEHAKEMKIDLRSDSELLVRQLNHHYKIEDKKIMPLFIQVWNLIIDFGSVTFTHVMRERNRAADKLVNRALDNESHGLF